ncbi:MAG: alanine racemase [Candidatus Kapaibacterium sp.]|nr:MAG: alanine racemase [Candidatus Kapabacteria bacterium]
MRPTRIEISASALRNNIALFRRIAPGTVLIAVVKANAYGHGMELVARTIEPLVDMFGVAFVEEGAALRVAGITKPILVLMTPTVSDAETIVAERLDVVACSLDVMQQIDRVARSRAQRIGAHVYVDTGMHRDGILPEEVPAFVEACAQLDGIELVGICTHFARSDERDCTMTTEQNRRFARVLDQLQAKGYRFPLVHAANTGAALQHPATHYSALRIGIGLYGIAPGEVYAPQLQPVLRLRTAVTAVRRIQAGEPVSYGTYYHAPVPTTIATIPIGYGDGFSRILTGQAECLIGGKCYPIVGAICMDECLVDVGNDPVAIGDEVVLIGSQGTQAITASQIAQRMGTIPYEVTTLLHHRIERQLVE